MIIIIKKKQEPLQRPVRSSSLCVCRELHLGSRRVVRKSLLLNSSICQSSFIILPSLHSFLLFSPPACLHEHPWIAWTLPTLLTPPNVTVCLPSWQTLHQTTGEIFWKARCAVFYFPPYILLKSRFLTVAMETQPHRDPSLGDTLLKWFFFFLFCNST